MRIDDEDYEFAIAHKFAAELNKSEKSEEVAQKVAKKYIGIAVNGARERLMWPLRLVGIIFALSNAAVLGFVFVAFYFDNQNIKLSMIKGGAYTRLVEAEVILALTAGVTVQSVAAFIAIVKGYYSGISGEKEE